MSRIKKIVFITGSRADFGKVKPLIKKLKESKNFEVFIFATGMHTLDKYGATIFEVIKEGFKNVYPFNNQINNFDANSILSKNLAFGSYNMNRILARTINGISDYVQIVKPEMIVVHGDRCEALAGAIVGALDNILVAHIEGGEVSGTIDESIRHAVTKMSHVHFVANENAKRRVIQLGENEDNVYVVGSADVDVMLSKDLPSLSTVKRKYEIPFDKFSIFIYHPITTDLGGLEENIKTVIGTIQGSEINYVVVYPNNDPGSEIIIKYIEKLRDNPRFRIFPSIRFEYFLTLLKNASFIIGNSSSGIREAGIYQIPTIDIGSRQQSRSKRSGIIKVKHDKNLILRAIGKTSKMKLSNNYEFGDGKAASRFYRTMRTKKVWMINLQKQFIDHQKRPGR